MFEVICTGCGVLVSNVSKDEANRWVRGHWFCPDRVHGDSVYVGAMAYPLNYR